MIDRNFQTYSSHLQGSRVQLSANNNYIATLGTDEIIFIFDNVQKQTSSLQLKNQQKLEITAFTIHPIFQNSFIFGTADGVVKYMRPIHNLRLNKAEIIFQTIHKTPIKSLNFSSSGKYLGIATETSSIMYCMKSKKTIKLTNQHEGYVNRIDFGNDQYIFSIGNEGKLHLYSIKNQQKQQDEDISEDLFGEMNSSIQVCFMDAYRLAIQYLTRKYFFMNASFCNLESTQNKKKMIFASGNSSLQTIEIVYQSSQYNIVRQIKQDSEILIVVLLNRGGNGKAITLALSTEKVLSIWNYSHLQKILSINILQQLKKPITCMLPVSQNMNPSFAFIVDNKDSNGIIYKFINQAVLDISQNKVNAITTHAIEQQKKQEEQQKQSLQEFTPSMRLITAYPQFPLQKGYEEYNRARFLFYNNIGCIIQRTQDTSSIMELQIHDKSRMRRMKLPRNKTFGLFCLKEKIFVCANSREIIFQEEKQLKQGQQPWQILWEEIKGIALGGNWLAAINNEEIKIFDFAGNELHTICFDRRYVTMQAYEDLLAVVYHGGLPAYGYQQLKVKIYKITTNSVTLDRDIIMPLKSKSILKWFGFSEEGMIVCQDTAEIVRAYSFFRNEWQSVYSLEGKQQCLFIQHIEGSVIFGFKLPHKKNERQQPKVLPRSLPSSIPMEWPDLKFQFFSKDQQKNLKIKILKNFILTHEEYRYQNWYKYKYSRRKDHPWYEQSKSIKSQEEIRTLKTYIDLSLQKYLEQYLSKTQLKGEKYKNMIATLLLLCQREIYLEENRKAIKQMLAQGHKGGFISKQTLSSIQCNLAFKPSIQTLKCKKKLNQISVFQQMLSVINYEV